MENILQKIYEEENLCSIMGLNKKYIINDINVFQEFNRAAFEFNSLIEQKSLNLFPIKIDQSRTEYIFSSEQILHFLVMTIYYKNKCLEYVPQKIVQESFVKHIRPIRIYESRFFMYSETVFEKLYSYWNRIINTIASLFNKHEKKNIFFSNIKDVIPARFREIESFKFFINYKDNEYINLNKQRRIFVHQYYSFSKTVPLGVLVTEDLNEIRSFYKKITNNVEFLKKAQREALFGFYYLIQCIVCINDDIRLQKLKN